MCPRSGGSKPRAKHPNEYWRIDITKLDTEQIFTSSRYAEENAYTEKDLNKHSLRSITWQEHNLNSFSKQKCLANRRSLHR